jgi:hypothetical protein
VPTLSAAQFWLFSVFSCPRFSFRIDVGRPERFPLALGTPYPEPVSIGSIPGLLGATLIVGRPITFQRQMSGPIDGFTKIDNISSFGLDGHATLLFRIASLCEFIGDATSRRGGFGCYSNVSRPRAGGASLALAALSSG